ncbi:MAG: response regulator [Fretibacterium sp.]|nr:response regulator [Fretibacterium sp.]
MSTFAGNSHSCDFEETFDGAGIRILAVDDHGPTLRVIKAMLEGANFDVTITNSSLNVMKAIEKSRPDLILLDYEMPFFNGRQVLEKLRANPSVAGIPVVFLTGINDRKYIEPLLALRPAGYLLKPLNKKKLLETIKKALFPAGAGQTPAE